MQDSIIYCINSYKDGQIRILEKTISTINNKIEFIFNKINNLNYYTYNIPSLEYYNNNLNKEIYSNYLTFNNNGYYSKQDIKPNTIIMSIPLKNSICLDDIENNREVMKIIDSVGLSDSDDIDIIIIFSIYLYKTFNDNKDCPFLNRPKLNLLNISIDKLKEFQLNNEELNNYNNEV